MADPGRIPGPKVVPQCLETQIFWGMPNARNASIIMHGRYTGVFNISQAQVDAFFTAVGAAFTSSGLAAETASDVSLSTLTVKDINAPNQSAIFPTGQGGGPGTSTALALPPQTALVVSLRTALTGQANRGRVYLPGWAANASGTGGIATPAAMAAAGAFVLAIRQAMAQNLASVPVIAQVARAAYTGRKGTQHPARPAQAQVISGSTVRDNIFDTQRRRSKP